MLFLYDLPNWVVGLIVSGGAVALSLAAYFLFLRLESRRARTLLREYARLVVAEEWTDMRTGHANTEAWRAIDNLFRTVGTIEPDTPKRVALLPEMWARTNELLAHRRDRLYTSQAEVPGTLSAVVLAGTILTMMTTFVLPPRHSTSR